MSEATLASLSLLLLSGCFYVDAAAGHLSILNAQQPIDQAVAAEQDPHRRTMLRLVPRVVAFARDCLQLRPGDNYTGYYPTEDDGVTHILVAAERTRLQAYEWWFPVVGSVPYKGFFVQQDAEAEADALRREGYDVWIVRGSAYSTLGLSRDPVTTIMMRRGPPAFVELLLHEMTHTRLYVQGETDFNEQLASFVARLGARRFFRQFHADDPVYLEVLERTEQRRDQLDQAVRVTAERLERLYDSGKPTEVILRQRQHLFDDLSAQARRLFPLEPPEELEMNNARILQFLRYQRRSDYLEAIWHRSGGSWPRFWRYAEAHAATL